LDSPSQAEELSIHNNHHNAKKMNADVQTVSSELLGILREYQEMLASFESNHSGSVKANHNKPVVGKKRRDESLGLAGAQGVLMNESEDLSQWDLYPSGKNKVLYKATGKQFPSVGMDTDEDEIQEEVEDEGDDDDDDVVEEVEEEGMEEEEEFKVYYSRKNPGGSSSVNYKSSYNHKNTDNILVPKMKSKISGYVEPPELPLKRGKNKDANLTFYIASPRKRPGKGKSLINAAAGGITISTFLNLIS